MTIKSVLRWKRLSKNKKLYLDRGNSKRFLLSSSEFRETVTSNLSIGKLILKG